MLLEKDQAERVAECLGGEGYVAVHLGLAGGEGQVGAPGVQPAGGSLPRPPEVVQSRIQYESALSQAQRPGVGAVPGPEPLDVQRPPLAEGGVAGPELFRRQVSAQVQVSAPGRDACLQMVPRNALVVHDGPQVLSSDDPRV